MFNKRETFLVSIICSIFLLLITSCSSPNVLLDIPPFEDNIPEFLTGYYTVTTDGDSSNFMGELVYLYKDDTFIDGKYFAGIKGSFLPNNYIKTKLVNGEIKFYWQNADDESQQGFIEFQEINETSMKAQVYYEKGVVHSYNLNFYKHHIWKDDVKTISIAHRGMCYQPPFNYDGIYPANAGPAFEAALRSGYEGFELDVHITKDEHFVISHDENLNVATTTHGKIENKTLKELENVLVIKSAPIPEKRLSASEAYIAAPFRPHKPVFEHFIDDPRLSTIVVDIKPDTDERIIEAAKKDFTGLSEKQQSRILFLTRSDSVAYFLKEICPSSDIALEGKKGTEPKDEVDKYMPEAVGLSRKGHNSISFGANWVIAARSAEKSLEIINQVSRQAEENNYKVLMWTFSKEERLNFLREHRIFPEFIVCDVPFYQYALQQMRYMKESNKELVDMDTVNAKYSNPVYERAYQSYVKQFWFDSRFLIDFTYGAGIPKHSDYDSDFAAVGNIELKLGRSEVNIFNEANINLIEFFLFGSYFNSGLYIGNNKENEITTEAFRFGIGYTDGFGYGGRSFGFVPYLSSSFVWTNITDYELAKDGSQNDLQSMLDSYKGTFRFGDRVNYGVKFDILSSLQVVANYETALIYPRHLFAQWVGSYGLMAAGYKVIDLTFTRWLNKYKIWGPIGDLVIKSAYLYGYYALRKNNMYWPFSSEAPLRYEFFNVGVSILL